MDGALHVIAKLFGTDYTQAVALGEEYAWTPEGGFVRATMADGQIPELGLDGHGTWHVERMEGDARRWDLVMRGTPSGPAAGFTIHIEQALEKGKWTKAPGAGAGSSRWTFTGTDGKPWKATVKFGAPNAAGELTAEI